jgi:hypothetical protein
VYVADSPKTPLDVVVEALVADGVEPHDTGWQADTDDHVWSAWQVLDCVLSPVETPLAV